MSRDLHIIALLILMLLFCAGFALAGASERTERSGTAQLGDICIDGRIYRVVSVMGIDR